MIFITSYNRPKMLFRLLKELLGESIVVIDDGSEYDYSEHLKYCQQYWRTEHYGKKGFWKLWNVMLEIARFHEAEEYIFLQDDLFDVDVKGLREINVPHMYALNLMNIGPDRNWTPKGYCDCNFKTNRRTLDAIGWKVKEVPSSRWDQYPNLSSGVGCHLSRSFYKRGIPMILPERNYASHGDHQSLMHPAERNRNPLVANTGE